MDGYAQTLAPGFAPRHGGGRIQGRESARSRPSATSVRKIRGLPGSRRIRRLGLSDHIYGYQTLGFTQYLVEELTHPNQDWGISATDQALGRPC